MTEKDYRGDLFKVLICALRAKNLLYQLFINIQPVLSNPMAFAFRLNKMMKEHEKEIQELDALVHYMLQVYSKYQQEITEYFKQRNHEGTGNSQSESQSGGKQPEKQYEQSDSTS